MVNTVDGLEFKSAGQAALVSAAKLTNARRGGRRQDIDLSANVSEQLPETLVRGTVDLATANRRRLHAKPTIVFPYDPKADDIAFNKLGVGDWSMFRGNIGEYNQSIRTAYADYIKAHPDCDVYEPNRQRLIQEGLLKAK